MTHKFDFKNINKLDNEWRRQNLPPVLTIEKLGLSMSDIVADIGCGIGYFTIPVAEFVGKRNNVYALDTSDEMLEELKKRAALADVFNIETIKTSEYDLKLPAESVTFAILVNVLHEIEDKKKFIEEIKRILKPDGKLAIIDWEKENMEVGPPINHRIGKEEVLELFSSFGIKLTNSLQFTKAFYGLIGVKGANGKRQ